MTKGAPSIRRLVPCVLTPRLRYASAERVLVLAFAEYSTPSTHVGRGVFLFS